VPLAWSFELLRRLELRPLRGQVCSRRMGSTVWNMCVVKCEIEISRVSETWVWARKKRARETWELKVWVKLSHELFMFSRTWGSHVYDTSLPFYRVRQIGKNRWELRAFLNTIVA
jgi:hypothetical protein